MLSPKAIQEAYLVEQAKERLLELGIVEQLKGMGIYIWAINAFLGGTEGNELGRSDALVLSVDISKAPKTQPQFLQELFDHVLGNLGQPVEIKLIPIEGHCCYGNCTGCLNGDPEAQVVWIGKKKS